MVYLLKKMMLVIFLLDVKIEVNNYKSLETDDLTDTISYADVFDVLKEEMAKKSKLLEHVGWRIIKHLKNKYSIITKIELKISKSIPQLKVLMDKLLFF